jgi:hypothetical protein
MFYNDDDVSHPTPLSFSLSYKSLLQVKVERKAEGKSLVVPGAGYSAFKGSNLLPLVFLTNVGKGFKGVSSEEWGSTTTTM